MESTRNNHGKFGRPMERESAGYAGGGQLFVLRRTGDFERGLLSEKGHNNNFLTFRPSGMFMRLLGDDVLRLNEALFDFRSQATERLMMFDDDQLQAHNGELNKRFEVVRDRLESLTAYCNKGFERLLDEAHEMAESWAEELSEDQKSGESETRLFGPSGPDVYEAVRKQNLEEGVLTETGSSDGYVAFRSCPLYGRVIGEIVYTFNDSLRRVEDRTGLYTMEGLQDQETMVKVRRFYTGLMRGMKLLRGELAEAVDFCRAEVGSG